MRAWKIIILVLLILVIFVFGGLVLLRLSGQTEPLTAGLFPSPTPAPPALPAFPAPGEGTGTPLERAYAQTWAYAPEGPCQSDGKTASQTLTLTTLDLDALAGSGLREELIARLSARAEQAGRLSELYTKARAYLPEILREEYETLLAERMSRLQDFCVRQTVTLRYVCTEQGWELQNQTDLYPAHPDADALFAAATAELPFFSPNYSIAEDAVCGPVPNEACFTVTEDPAVIAALLETPDARCLIGSETPVWNPDIAFIPGTMIRCYLDESILCIVWQEEEARGVGTFSEIFIADGSQFRRKISSDEPWSLWFEKTSDFARKANAVLAVGGDFYYHGRDCGISIYNRQIVRFRPDNADTCFITADGDMLFRYLGEDMDQASLEQYLIDNDVVFSLAFGPVLIDNGVDVTPDYYIWGEVRDYYARSALGLLGRHHYLTMNINCGKGEYDHLPSLRDAADAMVRRGCWKAYTLDGGQTATTVFHYELINPVQFGWEKAISDIIYFATAVPGE